METKENPGRHAAIATSSSGQLAFRWFITFRWHYILLFLSDFGQDLIQRKYDAFTTDRAYENRASGRFLVGKWVDWLVQRQALHEALRQRLQIVVPELVRLAAEFEKQGKAPARVVSGPCGLARDLILAAKMIGEKGSSSGQVEYWGVDLDFSSETLPEASRRAKDAAVELQLIRADLLDSTSLVEAFADKPIHVFNCIGLTPWLDLDDVERLFSTVRSLMEPGGAMIVDMFHTSPQSSSGSDFEIATYYHPDDVFEETLRRAGFDIERRQETANHINVVYTARKRA